MPLRISRRRPRARHGPGQHLAHDWKVATKNVFSELWRATSTASTREKPYLTELIAPPADTPLTGAVRSTSLRLIPGAHEPQRVADATPHAQIGWHARFAKTLQRCLLPF